MKHFLFFLLCCFGSLSVNGQQLFGQPIVRFGIIPEFGNEIIRIGDSGFYYKSPVNSNQVIFFSREKHYYKLFSEDSILLAEGEVGYSKGEIGYFMHREGIWKEYDSVGRLRNNFNYTCGFLNGLQENYYPNGKVAVRFNMTVLRTKYYRYYKVEDSFLSGSFKEYYDQGAPKIKGNYILRTESGQSSEIAFIDPITGNTYTKTLITPVVSSEKAGLWKYFAQDGTIEMVWHKPD